MRLTAQTEASDFLDCYWLKEELRQFCRDHGLSTTGGKRFTVALQRHL